MKILSATWLLTSNTNNAIIKDGAIVFEDKILDLGSIDYIKKKYPNTIIENLGRNSILMPGLINSHVHLEFCSNTTTLKYGNFITWLNSVIFSREELIQKASHCLLFDKLEGMKNSGTTTIAAISSYSLDLNSCLSSPINTVFFSEIVGSKPDMIDTLFANFKARLDEAKTKQSANFIPAIAIHSPYSVHPILVKQSLSIAKKEDIVVSAHFLESPEEFQWLHKSQGEFLNFFKNFLGQEKSVTKPIEFLQQFRGLKTLSFTHCVEASNNDLEEIKKLGAIINHCPTSNRFLNNSKLNIQKLIDEKIPFSIGTDGLSSNNSLSMFDELRNALMIHENINIVEFSKILIQAATKNGSDALGLNKGQLARGKDADIISFKLPDEVKDENDLCMNIILHTKKVEKIIIGGKYV